MSFLDNPGIDHFSEASEESVIAVKSLFCQRNGFLAREENPDKGVDLDVELLLDKQVSGFKFAIQIKSIQKLNKIKEKGRQYLRYPFKTSRLGYLCRRKPGLGIIVLYDDHGKRLYYEYVEKIYSEVTNRKGDDSWKNNETVTITIDQRNSLDNGSIKDIFKTMTNRHLNFSSMYAEHSFNFDLPAFDTDGFRDPLTVLEKYGYVFFNKNQYQVIFNMISALPPKRIVDNYKILLLAAITHYEIGYYMEGDLYAQKCRAFIDKYSKEEKELLSLGRLSSDFFFGKIDRLTYRKSLEELKNSMKKGLNRTLLRLKILSLDVFESSGKGEDFLQRLGEETFSIWAEFDQSETDDTIRQYYLVEILSCVHQIGILAFVDVTTKISIHRNFLGEPPLAYRVAGAQAVYQLVTKPFELLATVSKFASESADDHLIAMVLYKKNFMFATFSVYYAIFCFHAGKGIDEIAETFQKNLFHIAYDELIHAYNLFVGMMNLSNAYRALTLCLEVNFLYSVLFKGNIKQDNFDKVIAIIKDLEGKLGVDEYKVLAESWLKEYVAGKQAYPSFEIPTDKMRMFAREIVASTGIPEDRIKNLVADMEFLKQAENKINRKYFDLLQNLTHTKRAETLYQEKPKYVIRCKSCGYQTRESSELDVLLEDLGIEHCYTCL